MKLNKLAGLGIASIVLFGSIGQLAINGKPAQAIKPTQTTTIAAKPKSLISSGNFVKAEKTTTGKAKIVSSNGKRYLKFDQNFSTGNGPDVKVILHKNSSVPANIKEGNYITLSLIKSFNGEQTYEIPDNVNLDNYKSVGIWCEEFNATFGYASLKNA
ncbi:DM13 domain-containing protein [Calothrix rhizosoleniae]|uniref:DM13 domain-containing protein n=1 Tax=Calothrix rhizosoleniae TaxID=888997 RepID=UPI000B49DFD3|nr:DM13 domain-containing protein [Calothrix rhizosoleniae]